MLLTVFLAIIFCGAITLLLIAAVAFIQDKKFFSSAPKEALEVMVPRDRELFCGARAMGWTLMILSILMILAWMDTSRAETGSSQTMKSGFSESARAIPTTCRIPPSSSCG